MAGLALFTTGVSEVFQCVETLKFAGLSVC
jgi:hypothetical protein